jgi:L-alanine-DL-glutamate epimerase-like enolase superfamily enzyme
MRLLSSAAQRNSVNTLGPRSIQPTLHAISAKERVAPLERLFADVGFTAYSKTVPVENGAVDVPERPGLGADPEAEILERYTV